MEVCVLIRDTGMCQLAAYCYKAASSNINMLVSLHPCTATAIKSYRNTIKASLYDCQMLMQMGARVGKAGR